MNIEVVQAGRAGSTFSHMSTIKGRKTLIVCGSTPEDSEHKKDRVKVAGDLLLYIFSYRGQISYTLSVEHLVG